MSNYLTYEDEQNYGRDLLDVSRRAALDATAPHLQYLQQQNAYLQQQVSRDRRRALDERVAQLVPDYRTIDANPAWHTWLLGVDMLSGRVRQQLLNEGIQRGDANQVRAIFDRFRSQGQSTGTTRTASSRRSTGAKPFYSRADITRLYDQHRRGAFAGREDEWQRIEQDLFLAQREGRIEQKPYMTK
jgi:hypothetical protein